MCVAIFAYDLTFFLWFKSKCMDITRSGPIDILHLSVTIIAVIKIINDIQGLLWRLKACVWGKLVSHSTYRMSAAPL